MIWKLQFQVYTESENNCILYGNFKCGKVSFITMYATEYMFILQAYSLVKISLH